MENDSAFKPNSQTIAVTAAVTAPTAIQIPNSPASGPQISVYMLNSGTVVAAVASAPTAAQAATNAVMPVSGTPQQCTVLLPGQAKTITAAPGQYWTAVSASSTATVYLQTGEGI